MIIALIALKFVYFLTVCLHLSTDCFLLPQTLERKARAILNKLTPQKFDTLVGKFQELGINTEDKLQRCVACLIGIDLISLEWDAMKFFV